MMEDQEREISDRQREHHRHAAILHEPQNDEDSENGEYQAEGEEPEHEDQIEQENDSRHQEAPESQHSNLGRQPKP